jgi:hypothetical protein
MLLGCYSEDTNEGGSVYTDGNLGVQNGNPG